VQRGTTVTGSWQALGDAMPTLPRWVAGGSNGSVWAPEVAARSDGSYILYFTARDAARNVQCIGVALSRSPRGPFTSTADAPLVCRPADVDSIDPKLITDTDGKQYLLYTSGRGGATIWLQQVSVDGMTPIGERRALIRADRPDEAHIVEAPALIHHGNRYVLFYSGNAFNSGHYFINYASAGSLAGPFAKNPGELLNKDALGGGFTDPGGQVVVPGRPNDFLIFHAYTAPTRRSMLAATLTWDAQNRPVLNLKAGGPVAAPTP
jgi:beta-xylosidase